MNKPDNVKETFILKRRTSVHDQAEGWAVSYADFLMVLISFFIIYFNLEDQSSKENSSLSKIILTLSSEAEVKFYQKQGEKLQEVTSHQIEETKRSLVGQLILKDQVNADQHGGRKLASLYSSHNVGEKIRDGFLNFSLDESKKAQRPPKFGSEVIVDLPSNIYEINRYELTDKIKLYLDRVLTAVKEHQEKVNIIIIGHTDDLKFKDGAQMKILNNNMVLSSLRAARAVEYILGKGFSENQVFIKATNYQLRNSRSLSIQLVEK